MAGTRRTGVRARGEDHRYGTLLGGAGRVAALPKPLRPPTPEERQRASERLRVAVDPRDRKK